MSAILRDPRAVTLSSSGGGSIYRRPTSDEGLSKYIKLAQPDLYYGERDKLEG